MPKLSLSSLSPDEVLPKPRKAGILHIGLGAFHRAHQAVYTEDAMADTLGDWGIVGVSLRSHDIVEALKQQDFLYTVTTRSGDGDKVRVVSCIVDAVAASTDPDAILRYLEDPGIRIVSLTVTEKAYGLLAESGGLDRTHPAIAHDLKFPDRPVGVIGYIVEGLARRRDAGHAPYTVLCCDNLPSNGDVVARLVKEMAGDRDSMLADWIDENVTFPNTMVDRIVPAATSKTRLRASNLLGIDDQLALETEAFSQWVIEDRFIAGRPAWEAAGVLFVESVAPYEKMKLRLLNGAHSLIAYLGQLHGLRYVRDVMAVQDYVALVRRHLVAAAETLDPVPGVEIATYIEDLLQRFANPAIAHETRQIAIDGSQKLPQRIFAPAIDVLKNEGDISSFAFVSALWISFVLRQASLDDPRASDLLAAAHSAREESVTSSKLRHFINVPGLFPRALVDDFRWRDHLAHQMEIVSEMLPRDIADPPQRGL